jgi:hypothetical protein
VLQCATGVQKVAKANFSPTKQGPDPHLQIRWPVARAALRGVPSASGGQAWGGEGGGGLLRSAGSLPVPGRRQHGRQWPVTRHRCWGPTFPGLSVGEGFGCLMLCPVQVGGGLWWFVTSADLVLTCEPVS